MSSKPPTSEDKVPPARALYYIATRDMITETVSTSFPPYPLVSYAIASPTCPLLYLTLEFHPTLSPIFVSHSSLLLFFHSTSALTSPTTVLPPPRLAALTRAV